VSGGIDKGRGKNARDCHPFFSTSSNDEESAPACGKSSRPTLGAAILSFSESGR